MKNFFKRLFSMMSFGPAGSDAAPVDSGPPRTHILARLNHLIMPIDRGERYEDPLNELLAAQGLGEIVGGGTSQHNSGEIQFVDIEIALTDPERGISLVVETLESLGAPAGSRILFEDSEKISLAFGVVEGVGVYIDGANLPPEVYKNADINHVIAELGKSLKDSGEFQSYWEGGSETGLYFYGRSASEMMAAMQDFLNSYPLCQNARVVQLAPPVAATSA